MRFDYFYEEESDSFAFYRIPKVLFTDVRFIELSTDARVLYGLLLDRVSLSTKNAWVDEAGRVYIYFTIDAVKENLSCANQKACDLLKELEEFGLIEKKYQGLCKPTKIYVKNFTRFRNAESQSSDNQNPGGVKIRIQEFSNSEGNKTKNNNTDVSKTNPIHSEEEERRSYEQYFMDSLQIEWLKETNPYNVEEIEEIYELIVDTVCSKRQMIRIAGDDKPINVVKSKFMKLTSEHIQFVMSCMNENTTKVRNMKQYLLAALYNAPLTIGNYYQSLVKHDMAEGKI